MRSRRLAVWIFIVLISSVLATSGLLADIREDLPEGDDIIIDIWGTSSGISMVRKDPLAVPLFKNVGPGADRMGLSRKFADLVSEDMGMTGRFDVIDRAIYVENPNTAGAKPGTFSFEDWRIINAEYLIKGSFSLEGDKLIVQFRLYHVPTKKLLLGKEYQGQPDDWYLMVHRFGNDVMSELTGERGIFGTKVAYVSGARTSRELHVVDIDGRNKKRLTYLNGQASSPSWSPDGRQLCFAWRSNDSADPHSYIYIIGAQGGRPEEIFKVKGLAMTPRFSPSGTRVALAISYNGNMEIYTISARGGKPKRLTASRAIELFPTWSPHGDHLLFVSDRSGGPQIWKMRADGSDVQRISWHGAYNQSPDWSPKGDRVVYSARESGHYGIIMTRPNGTDAMLITQGQGFGTCEYPYFSPDGMSIVLTTDAGRGRAIRIFNVDASYTKLLTRPGSNDKNPSWSPRLLD